MKDNLHTGLVLQGGGALGAYEYGAIKALYEARPGFTPTVITGLSIGSVNAAILAGADDPIRTLDRIWREDFAVLAPLPFGKVWQSLVPAIVQQNLAHFGNQGMYRLRPQYLLAPWFTSSVYDTSQMCVRNRERKIRRSRRSTHTMGVSSERKAAVANKLIKKANFTVAVNLCRNPLQLSLQSLHYS